MFIAIVEKPLVVDFLASLIQKLLLVLLVADVKARSVIQAGNTR